MLKPSNPVGALGEETDLSTTSCLLACRPHNKRPFLFSKASATVLSPTCIRQQALAGSETFTQAAGTENWPGWTEGQEAEDAASPCLPGPPHPFQDEASPDDPVMVTSCRAITRTQHCYPHITDEETRG